MALYQRLMLQYFPCTEKKDVDTIEESKDSVIESEPNNSSSAPEGTKTYRPNSSGGNKTTMAEKGVVDGDNNKSVKSEDDSHVKAMRGKAGGPNVGCAGSFLYTFTES